MTTFAQFWSTLPGSGRALPYLLIDSAGLDGGRAEIPQHVFDSFECLFTGDLAQELEDVAPYLGRLASLDGAVGETVEQLLRNHLGLLVLLAPGQDVSFSELHRHFRKHNVVYGPEGNPLFFRYYDPRSLLDVLDVFDATQLAAFFGPVETLAMFDREGVLVRCYRQGDGSLALVR